MELKELKNHWETIRMELDALPSDYIQEYKGKVRLNCDKFTAGIQVRIGSGFGAYYGPADYQSITKSVP